MMMSTYSMQFDSMTPITQSLALSYQRRRFGGDQKLGELITKLLGQDELAKSSRGLIILAPFCPPDPTSRESPCR